MTFSHDYELFCIVFAKQKSPLKDKGDVLHVLQQLTTAT